MFDTDSRDTPQRARSLLSLGASGTERPASHPVTDREDDAITRHRLARSRREAQPNPLLKALADRDKPAPRRAESTARQAEAAPTTRPDQEPHGGLGRLLSNWTRRSSRSEDRVFPDDMPRERETGAKPPARESGGRRVQDQEQPVYGGGDFGQPRDAGDDRWKPLIDPMKLIGGVMRSKMLIVSTTILGAILGVAIAISTPKKYESATELLIDPRDLKIVERDLTSGGLTNEATLAIVENQVRVLTSGSVLNQVVDKLNLANDPEFNGESGGGIGGIISSLRSLLSRQDAGGGDNRRALAVGNLAKSLSVERGGKTFVVVVSVVTQEPEKSALIANTMTDVFLTTYGKLQSDTAGRAADELTARLDELRKSVEAAERKVETFKAENDIIDAQGRLITDDEILKLNEQLSVARAKTLELNAKAASTRQLDVDAVVGGTLPEEAASNVLVELRSQYASMKQQSDALAVKLGPRHPQSQAMAAQLTGARDQIASELRRIVSSIQIELKRAVQLEQELASRLAQLKVRQGDLSGELVTLRELERDATAKRAVYEAFLLRARETGEQKDLNTANMSVISTAFPPLESIGPSRAMISIAGMMLGFMAGIGAGLVRGTVDSLRDRGSTRPTNRSAPPSGGDGGGGQARRRAESRPTYDRADTPVRQPAPSYRSAPALQAAEEEPAPDRAATDRDVVEHVEQEPETVFQKLRAMIRPAAGAEDAHRSAATAGVLRYPAAETQLQPQQYAAPQPVAAPQFVNSQPPHPAYAAPLPAQPPMQHQQPMQSQMAAAMPMQQPLYPQMAPQPAFAPSPFPQPWPAQPAPMPHVYGQPVHAYPGQPQPPYAAYPAQPMMQPATGYPMQQPAPAYPMAQPVPYAAPPAPYYPASAAPVPVMPQPAPAQAHSYPAAAPSPMDEVRASLREFRDAVHDLTESRARRRYS